MHKIKEGEIKHSETKMVLPKKYIDIVSQRYAPLNNFVLNGDIEGFLDIIIPKNDSPEEITYDQPKPDNPFIIK
jgi:hypothetical protein